MKSIAPALLLVGLGWPLLTSSALADAVPHYLIEVIVLTHVDGRSDARQVEALDDFTALIDPLRQSRVVAWQADREGAEGTDVPEPGQAETDAQRQASEIVDLFTAMDALDSTEALPDEEIDPGPIYPDVFINQPQLSAAMQTAWNRLENSREFQPRVWRAWYQPLSRTQLSPQVRIHDEVPVRVDWAELAVPGLTGRAGDWQIEHLMPQANYRVDGGLRLRMRQFMHVELDLVWRELSEGGSEQTGPWAPDVLAPTGYLQHRLSQSRAVRQNRLEYFDSEWLSVLVRIQRWEPPQGDGVEAASAP